MIRRGFFRSTPPPEPCPREKRWCLLYHITYVIMGLILVGFGYHSIVADDLSTLQGIFFLIVGFAFSVTFGYRCYVSECRGIYPEQDPRQDPD